MMKSMVRENKEKEEEGNGAREEELSLYAFDPEYLSFIVNRLEKRKDPPSPVMK